MPSLPYKVNIYAMVEDADSLNESKELHEKVRTPIIMTLSVCHSPPGDHVGGRAGHLFCF